MMPSISSLGYLEIRHSTFYPDLVSSFQPSIQSLLLLHLLYPFFDNGSFLYHPFVRSLDGLLLPS